jgi:hypothetical protein
MEACDDRIEIVDGVLTYSGHLRPERPDPGHRRRVTAPPSLPWPSRAALRLPSQLPGLAGGIPGLPSYMSRQEVYGQKESLECHKAD